jgi:hypothetical protein
VVLVVSSQNQQREVVLYGDPIELERLVQGAGGRAKDWPLVSVA